MNIRLDAVARLIWA